MPKQVKIDFVSDVSCPWCVIGLKSLETALVALKDEVAADLHFQPFELNPQMGAEGQDITEHIAEKCGSTTTDIERNRENIRGKQEALKNALFSAYFTEGRNPSDHEVLLDVFSESRVGSEARVRDSKIERVRGRSGARETIFLRRSRHPGGAFRDHQRQALDSGRPAGRSIRERAATIGVIITLIVPMGLPK
jgi:hypothetical protein